MSSEEFEWARPMIAERSSFLNQLATILQRINEALAEGTGWAVDDIEISLQLIEISSNMGHLKSSIRWLAMDLLNGTTGNDRLGATDQTEAHMLRTQVSGQAIVDPEIEWLLTLLESQASPTLASMRLHLNSMSQNIDHAKHAHTKKNQDRYVQQDIVSKTAVLIDDSTRLTNVHIADVAASVECFEAQLTPLKSFVEMQKIVSQYRPDVAAGKTAGSSLDKSTENISAEFRGVREFTHSGIVETVPAENTQHDRNKVKHNDQVNHGSSPIRERTDSVLSNTTTARVSKESTGSSTSYTQSRWIWSEPHLMYYYPIQDAEGKINGFRYNHTNLLI